MAIETIPDDEYDERLGNEDDGLPDGPDVERNADRKREPIALPVAMRPAVLSMIARWGGTEMAFTRISNELHDEYNIIFSPAEVERLYNANRNKVVAIRKKQREGIAVKQEKQFNKANTLIAKELDRMYKDMEKRNALDIAFEKGAIDAKEYRKGLKALRVPSISDLVKVANHFAPKAPAQPPAPMLPPGESGSPQSLPAGSTPQETALARELAEAVKRGDEVKIQQILWQKNPSAQSNFASNSKTEKKSDQPEPAPTAAGPDQPSPDPDNTTTQNK